MTNANLHDFLGWKPEPEPVRAVEFPKRFARFPMAAEVPVGPYREQISYRAEILEQIGPSCVGFSIRTKLNGEPIRTHRGPDALSIYRAANSRDEWAGTPHDGTTVRAGMDVILEAGLIDAYVWAEEIDDAIAFLACGGGPVIVGTLWYDQMFYPDVNTGLIRPKGPIVGGHAYCIRRLDKPRGLVGIAQTWGRDWGKRGYALMQIEDLEKLIFAQDGECATALETKRGAVNA